MRVRVRVRVRGACAAHGGDEVRGRDEGADGDAQHEEEGGGLQRRLRPQLWLGAG